MTDKIADTLTFWRATRLGGASTSMAGGEWADVSLVGAFDAVAADARREALEKAHAAAFAALSNETHACQRRVMGAIRALIDREGTDD